MTDKSGNISIEIDGVVHEATWTARKGMLTVDYMDGLRQKTTQLGGHTNAPELLAKMILREIAVKTPDQ